MNVKKKKKSLIGGGPWAHKNKSIFITFRKVENKLQILDHWRLGNYGNRSIYKPAHIRKPVSTARKKCDSTSCHFGPATSEENWDKRANTNLRVCLYWTLQCFKSWSAVHLVHITQHYHNYTVSPIKRAVFLDLTSVGMLPSPASLYNSSFPSCTLLCIHMNIFKDLKLKQSVSTQIFRKLRNGWNNNTLWAFLTHLTPVIRVSNKSSSLCGHKTRAPNRFVDCNLTWKERALIQKFPVHLWIPRYWNEEAGEDQPRKQCIFSCTRCLEGNCSNFESS